MGNDQPDYYELLGVERTAPAEEITRAYRRAMRAVHPDASGTSGLFRLVKTAYDTLKDPASRAAYDARSRTVPPEPPPRPRPEPEPEPEPKPRPGPESGNQQDRKQQRTKQPGAEQQSREQEYREHQQAGQQNTKAGPRRPYGTGSSQPRVSFTKPRAPEPEPESAPRVRPRFGAHWFRVVAIVVWTVAALAAVYALWPAGFPVEFMLLLLLPLIALPVVALEPTLRSQSWLWAVCVLPFAAATALAAADADGGAFWTLCAALAALAAGGAGLAAAPHIVRQGRELDRLIAPDSLGYQIFNVAGAGLDGDPLRQRLAQESATGLETLAQLNGVRIVHAITAPQPSGQPLPYVDHVVMRGNRLALVMARRWPAGTYAWTGKGVITTVGRPFSDGDTGIAAAVKEIRKVVPRGVRVRGFVAVLPDDPVRSSSVKFPVPENGDLLVGDLAQVREAIEAWLGEGDPVVQRRVLAALLPHLRHP
ncbi:J domain-containing protein [Spirillospora sp. CA-142024]|uniref:J domain-containing protein n=1 Tax=Spirillospora sp. CA-142024 TaxID=3240036 RepID=UPI003D8D13C6